MQRLNLPTYSFNIKSADSGDSIFDECRRRWVALTPEEWVRQNLLRYLTNDLGYPVSLVATEMSIKINGLSRRCDIVVFNRSAQPVLIAECKAPVVPLNQKVFDQVARYNWDMQVPFLLISNGISHHCAQLDQIGRSVRFLESIPHYSELEAQSLEDS